VDILGAVARSGPIEMAVISQDIVQTVSIRRAEKRAGSYVNVEIATFARAVDPSDDGTMSDSADPRIAYVRANRDRYLGELKAWIACPSISNNPAHAGDVRRSAETVVARLAAAGMTHAEVLETGGHPVAYGEWLGAPGAPTILIYGHHDVQPVDPLALWTTPPFEADVRDGKIYGRGAVDDKGQVLMHVAALEAHLRVNGRLPINVKVVVEGEEEIQSPNFETFLARERDRLNCDVVVVSDTAVFAEDVPSLTVSLRGTVGWEVTVHGPATDLHSGYYGGTVRNPLEALAQMLATLKAADGRIAVAGFYDDVRALTEDERADFASLPYDEAAEARAIGVPALAGEAGFTPIERMWRRPTLEINGMFGGYQGPGGKTIIPSFATAKLSARLVPAQDPAHVKRVVTDHLRAVAPAGVRVDIVTHGDVRAVETSRDHPAVAAAARAMERGFGKPPVFIGTGGTIGPVSSFDRILGLPQVLIGVGLPDDAIHAPNEKFDLGQFFGGIETMTYLYDELAAALTKSPA
jgi:acetylornithine deacetylase/succinyl-diaminopimelate desuccinylase-like protein